MRTTTTTPDTCELCGVGYDSIHNGVVVINHRGVISGDLYRCPAGCGDEVVHVNESYHNGLKTLNLMVEFYPQWVIDTRENIKIFEAFDGLGMMDMARVQRELEASTFKPDMMELRRAHAAVRKKAGATFVYEPKTFLTAAAKLRIKRFEESS